MKLPRQTRMRHAFCLAALLALPLGTALAGTPAELLAAYNARAASPGSPERGQQFFTTAGPGEFGWSCASCHGKVPTGTGRHELSEKRIPPLAPAFNPARFTDAKKTDGWFQNNCKDVLKRDCTVQEKADVLAWLISLKP